MVQRIAGEIKGFDPEGWVARKFARRMDKFMLYLLTAGKKAVIDAGLTEVEMEELDKSRCGVLIGSAMGGMQVLLQILCLSLRSAALTSGDELRVVRKVCFFSVRIHLHMFLCCFRLLYISY